MSEVVLDQIRKAFGGVVAVDDLSLRVEEGEFVTLLGPSGCGKSTTLRVIAGLETPDLGRVVIGGVPMTDTPPYARNVGLVFQNGALFPHKSVLDNVAFGLKMRGTQKRERHRKAEAMLDVVQLSGLGSRMPRELSGGQQQRVALARALVISPKVLLLDEPLSALDLRLRQQLRSEIREIQKHLGITAIFVTHDQVEALSLSDRVAVMNSGRVEQVGAPSEIYTKPRTEFVAAFLGETNALTGTVVQLNASRAKVHTDAGLQLWVPKSTAPLSVGETALLMIRPDALSVEPVEDEPGPDRVNGQVYLTSFLGSLVRYHITLDKGVRIFADQSMASASARLEPGARVLVSCPGEGVFCFRPGELGATSSGSGGGSGGGSGSGGLEGEGALPRSGQRPAPSSTES